jgi:hypothetical protein
MMKRDMAAPNGGFGIGQYIAACRARQRPPAAILEYG